MNDILARIQWIDIEDTYIWGVIEVEMSFLNRLSVVALWARETEQALLEKITILY